MCLQAVIGTGQILASRIAGNGQQQSFEKTKKHSEFTSFVKVIASIEDPAVIQKILAHLDDNTTSAATALRHIVWKLSRPVLISYT